MFLDLWNETVEETPLEEGSSHPSILTGIIMHGEMNKILGHPSLLEFPKDEQLELVRASNDSTR